MSKVKSSTSPQPLTADQAKAIKEKDIKKQLAVNAGKDIKK